MRSDSKDTSKETVPLPSSMLVRRRMPAGVDISFATGNDHISNDDKKVIVAVAVTRRRMPASVDTSFATGITIQRIIITTPMIVIQANNMW